MAGNRKQYRDEEEQALMIHLWTPEIADDPEMFVRFAFPWGKENTPLHEFSGPKKWQVRVLREMASHIREQKKNKLNKLDLSTFRKAVASGRGIGKSALISWIILWMLSTRIGSTVIVSANSEPQLKSVTWGELAKWHAMAINKHWFDISATKLVPADWYGQLIERDLKKGLKYYYAEGKLWSEENPDAYAGVHSQDGMMVIFDEGSGIPQPIWDVAQGYFTDPIVDRYWMAFSNPRRNEGLSLNASMQNVTSGIQNKLTQERWSTLIRRYTKQSLTNMGLIQDKRRLRSMASFLRQEKISSYLR